MSAKPVPKPNSWKIVQAKAQAKKRNRLALLVLLGIVTLLLLSGILRFTKTLFTPLNMVPKRYSWNGEFNINVLLRTPLISLLSYNPKEEKITIVNIPDETLLQVPHGFGSWQARSVYGLGGDELLADSLASFLGVPIDGFIDISFGQKEMTATSIVSKLKENPLSGSGLSAYLKSSLTPWELLKLKMGIYGVRFDKIRQLNPAKANIIDKSSLPDGTEVYTADPVKLDSILSDFTDPSITAEHKSIAVLNATDNPQLAKKWARLITNLGGNVIITTNAKKKVQKTQVLGEESKTLKRLRQIFDLGCQNDPKCDIISLSDEDLISSRAQINVFLGADYADK